PIAAGIIRPFADTHDADRRCSNRCLLARVGGSRVPLSRHLFQPFLSPDGQWLATPLIDGATTNVWALPTAGGPMRQLTVFGDWSILIARSVSWSADSRYLYAAVAESETDIVLFDGLVS